MTRGVEVAKRKGLSKKTRFEVFKRDGFRCQYCGRTPPVVILQIDHIIPVAADGPSVIGNLVTACEDCNAGKSDRDLKQVPESLKAQIAKQKERHEQVQEYNRFLMEMRDSEDTSINLIGRHWFNVFDNANDQYVFSPSSTEFCSIRTFLKSLTTAEILEAIDVSHARWHWYNGNDRKPFQYFCGVCWKKIRRARGEDV